MVVKCISKSMYISQAEVGKEYRANDKGNRVEIVLDDNSVVMLPKVLFNQVFEVLDK